MPPPTDGLTITHAEKNGALAGALTDQETNMTHATQEQRRRKLKALCFSLLLLILLAAAYLFGAYSYPRNTWLIALIKNIETRTSPSPIVNTGPSVVTKFDRFGRLVFSSNKKEVDCPRQTKDMAVILAFGQSNSANNSPSKIRTQPSIQVLNYFDGKCYVADSPLLGATGDGGEFITRLADNLIKDKVYQSVIIVSTGVAGTPISRWQEDGDLNDMLLATIASLKNTYRVTDLVWHQGESDFMNKTSAKVYVKSFKSLLKTLENPHITPNVHAFISVSTKCGSTPDWTSDNPTAAGQKMLVDNKKIFLGANTDLLLEQSDRAPDGCHFSESGLRKTADAYADSMKTARRVH